MANINSENTNGSGKQALNVMPLFDDSHSVKSKRQGLLSIGVS
ncbi:hypothetical protein [Psychrobacter sp. NG254]|nr:hypothetical protein [Psychrobacter sp. NG254]